MEERVPKFVAEWGTVSSVEGWVSGLYCSMFSEVELRSCSGLGQDGSVGPSNGVASRPGVVSWS